MSKRNFNHIIENYSEDILNWFTLAWATYNSPLQTTKDSTNQTWLQILLLSFLAYKGYIKSLVIATYKIEYITHSCTQSHS